MSFAIPKSLKTEHDHLHKDLKLATTQGGRTGDAARVVADRLHAHFEREEEFAMPPLGLLAAVTGSSSGPEISPDETKKAITMADRLADELPHMLAEHQEIVAALHLLIAAAQEENHPEVVEFAEKLMLHAQTEEEVLYPAAIIVGRYLKLEAQVRSGTASAISV
ncbi:hypothetical protein [uncultured Paracoccus sp.]|uniref:hypothetical protein n=1 Tax=uncultured Paracoccus sp. TaxID=189685 RepID=UPI002610BB0D|nr:hypothetical protein [uncultured Paracoccus sp.]